MKGIRWALAESVLWMRNQQDGPHHKLVVGLGNPGRQYANMRHNVGFWCVERLARESSIAFTRRRRHAVSGEGTIGGVPVVLAKPRTFVNDSGRAITSLLARYGASPADLLVVYDDMDLPQGELRLRPSGSAGGHNGMKSILEAIGTQSFARLRIGIGRPPVGVDEVEYVLGAMAPEERKRADEVVERATQAVICTLAEGIDVAMNRFN
jgi:PTH1 family peptidyl-tRNA hydrolase